MIGIICCCHHGIIMRSWGCMSLMVSREWWFKWLCNRLLLLCSAVVVVVSIDAAGRCKWNEVQLFFIIVISLLRKVDANNALFNFAFILNSFYVKGWCHVDKLVQLSFLFSQMIVSSTSSTIPTFFGREESNLTKNKYNIQYTNHTVMIIKLFTYIYYPSK